MLEFRIGTLLLLLASSTAVASPCGGKNERACCVGERKSGACDSGLHEEGGCKGNCKCGNSIFSSSGTCRKDKDQPPMSLPGLSRPGIQPCGGKNERACCLGERKSGNCDRGLREVDGCKGDCRCGGVSFADSSGTCRAATPCGAVGQRACCVGERQGKSCDGDLVELPGCQGDCQCSGPGFASSSGTCSAGLSLVKLTRQAELEKLFGKPVVDRLVLALSKTVFDPRNTDKWARLSAAATSRLPLANAIAANSRAFVDKANRDAQRYAAEVKNASGVMARIMADSVQRARVGTLLLASAEGRFDDPAAQDAASALASFTRTLFPPKAAPKAAAPGAAAAKGVSAGDVLEAVAPYLPKSFGVTLGWEAGAHVGIAGGFSGSFGFVADCDVTESLYDIRATYGVGEGVGVGGKAAAYDLAVAALYHVWPTQASGAPGGSFGLVGGGGVFVTANAELEWGFITKKEPAPGDVPPKSWLGGMPVQGGYSVLVPIPSIGVGMGIQLDPGAAILFQLGWTATFGRPGTGGLCDDSGCWNLGM